MLRCAAVFLVLVIGSRIHAGEPQAQARQFLEPQALDLPAGPMSLVEALALLHKQTGNVVQDQRRTKSNPLLKLEKSHSTFWATLDRFTLMAGCGSSPYLENGGVALVDTPRKVVPVSYAGIYRIALRRLSHTRDFEAGTTSCQLALEIAWEPRFEPFYLDLGPSVVDLGGGKAVKIPSRSQEMVAGRSAMEVLMNVPVEPGLTPRMLKSQITAIGPSKMLSFRFDKLQAKPPLTQTLEDVKVTLAQIQVRPGRWTVEVRIDNPSGGPRFESFQSWLHNNQIRLERTQAGKQVTWTPDPNEQEELEVRAERALVRYHFTDRNFTERTQLADWTLVYRTPGRIVELAVPFELPLPK